MFSPLLKNEPVLKMLSKNGNVLAKRYFNKFHKKPLEGVILNSSFNKDSTTVSFIAHENNRSSTDKPYTVCFNNIFLRDSSRSSNSVDVRSGQKLFTTGELATDSIHTTPELVKITPDGKFLTIKWKDGDLYDYPLEFLYKYKGSTFVTRSLRNRHTSHRPTLWDTLIFNDHLKTFAMDYDEFLHDDKRFYDALIN